MIILTDKAKEAIQEELDFYLSMEDEQLQIHDMGLILFVRKQSCSPMTEGGHKEIGVGVELIKTYQKNPKFELIENLSDLENLVVFIEKDALEMLRGRTTIEIDSRGAIEKELVVVDGPIIDLGSCEVRFKRS